MKQLFVFLLLSLFPLIMKGQSAGGQVQRITKKKQATNVSYVRNSKTTSKKKQTSETTANRKTTSTAPQKESVQVELAEAAGYDVSFSSNVPTAVMKIDGMLSGSPSGIRFLKTGKHIIKLTANNYEDLTDTIVVNSISRQFSFTMEIKKMSPKERVLKNFVASICSLYDIELSKTEMKDIEQRFGIQQIKGTKHMEIKFKDGTEIIDIQDNGKCGMITIDPRKIKKSFPYMDGMGWDSSYKEWNEWFVSKSFDSQPYNPYYDDQSMLVFHNIILMFSGKERERGTWFSLILSDEGE